MSSQLRAEETFSHTEQAPWSGGDRSQLQSPRDSRQFLQEVLLERRAEKWSKSRNRVKGRLKSQVGHIQCSVVTVIQKRGDC